MGSSILSSQGGVALAMAVSAGTVIVLAFRLQKSFPDHDHHRNPLRSCLYSEEKKREKRKKKKVHFAKDVIDPRSDGEKFRRRIKIKTQVLVSSSSSSSDLNSNPKEKNRGMPANRVALYNGILRDRFPCHSY